jgi:hypothetical protein
MVIDATMRGVEQYIDSIVIATPNIVRIFFDSSKKTQLQIQNEKVCTGGSFGKYTKCFFDNLRFYTSKISNSRGVNTNQQCYF